MQRRTLIMFLSFLLFYFSGGNFPIDSNNNSHESYALIKNVFAETEEESLIQKIIEKNSQSVVTIEIENRTKENTTENNNGISNFIPTKFLSGFFKIANLQSDNDTKEKKHNIGTGFIVTPDGLIVTNRHVVAATDSNYNIIAFDGKKYKVSSIYRVPNKEIAVLKINPPAGGQNLKAVEMADSNNVKVGQMAIAIGTVFGNLENTITVGIISGKNRSVSVESPENGTADKLDGLLQTDAALNFGNSGGPLLNSSGQVIGINTISSLVGNNVGFAIPINQVKDVLKAKYNI